MKLIKVRCKDASVVNKKQNWPYTGATLFILDIGGGNRIAVVEEKGNSNAGGDKYRIEISQFVQAGPYNCFSDEIVRRENKYRQSKYFDDISGAVAYGQKVHKEIVRENQKSQQGLREWSKNKSGHWYD